MSSFFIIGSQVAFAMGMLYLLLGITSAGVTLKTWHRPHSQLRQQVNAWWRILPVVSLSLWLLPLGSLLLALLIGALALRELAAHAAPSARLFQCCAGLMLVVQVGGWLRPAWFAWLLPLACLLQLLHFAWRRRTGHLLWLLFLLTCFGVGFLQRYSKLPYGIEVIQGWLFYLYALTALNDVAQFVCGTMFGRQKVAPTISPNKTWQGLAGGIIVTVLLSLLLGGYLRLAGPATLACFGLLLSLGGFGGDLAFSAAKRRLGVKDFSQLIPGHGGILDRVDSLVVTAPLLYLLLHFGIEGHLT